MAEALLQDIGNVDSVDMRRQKILIFALSAEGGFEMDVKDIITKVAGNKDLLDKLKSADVNQAKDLLNKCKKPLFLPMMYLMKKEMI